MRRQAGADTVDLDTIEGYAHYALHHPARIDFAAIEDVAHDTGYTLRELILEIEGVTSMGDCAECGGPVPMLKVAETGQVFELEGDVPQGETLWIRASVHGWGGGHARLTLLPSEGESIAPD